MRKLTTLLLGLVALVGLASQAGAVNCTIDQVPAATLLVPYFEVDLDDPNGLTTLFAITNVSQDSMVAHVTVWTNISTAILDFNIYLTGYDVQTVNMRDIFNGILPKTGTTATSPHSGALGPYGFENSLPGPSATAFGCTGSLSTNYANLSPGQVDQLRAYFTEEDASCPVDSGHAIGYITIDNTLFCNLFFPNDAGYELTLSDDNVFIGDIFYVDSANNFASGTPAVHIEADADFELAPLVLTFYSKYVDANGGIINSDHREPLPEAFAFRYANGGSFDGGTTMQIWRSNSEFTEYAGCDADLGFDGNEIFIFDEMENVVTQGGPSFPPILFTCPFCIEAQAVDVGATLPIPDDFGWIWVSFDTTLVAFTNEFYDQAWVETQWDALGKFQVGFSSSQVLQRCEPLDEFPTIDLDDAIDDQFVSNK